MAGSGAISSDPSITIQALFRRLGADKQLLRGSCPSSAGVNEFQIPFDATTFAANGAQIYTGIAIANLDPVNSAKRSVYSAGLAGNVIPNALTVPALNPSGHWAKLPFSSVDSPARDAGLRFQYKGRLDRPAALGVNALSSLPVIPIR